MVGRSGSGELWLAGRPAGSSEARASWLNSQLAEFGASSWRSPHFSGGASKEAATMLLLPVDGNGPPRPGESGGCARLFGGAKFTPRT